MTGLAPELLGHDDGRRDLLIAAPLLELAHGGLERAPDALALRMPERRPGRHVVEREQVERHAEPAVVALLRLFAAPQVGVELFLRRPRGAVDALEHRALLVAAPVGPGRAEQLERADLARARDVRATAQVDERPLPVEGRRRHRRAVALRCREQVVDDLDLERLIALDQRGARRLRGLLAELERVVGRDRFAHPLLDLRQVVRRQRSRQQEVVVEPVLDHRPDAELGAREEVEHRLGQHVRRAVAHRTELAGGAVIHELGRAATLGCVQLDRSLVDLVLLVVCHAPLPGISKPLVRAGREVRSSRGSTRVRGAIPAPRSLAALSGGSRIGSPIARGWCRSGSVVGLPALARLSGDRWNGSLRPARRVRSGCGGRHWTRTSDLLHVKQVL